MLCQTLDTFSHVTCTMYSVLFFIHPGTVICYLLKDSWFLACNFLGFPVLARLIKLLVRSVVNVIDNTSQYLYDHRYGHPEFCDRQDVQTLPTRKMEVCQCVSCTIYRYNHRTWGMSRTQSLHTI